MRYFRSAIKVDGDYILVSQEEAMVECYTRQSDGDWLLTIHKGLDSKFALSAVHVEVTLLDLY